MEINTIKLAVETLEEGGVIAYPSEGVWGLGCDPFNQSAVMKILELKSRSVDKGLILVASSLEQLTPLLSDLPPEYQKLLVKACPGPDTWLIPDPSQFIPPWIKGQFATVAVRISEHPLIKAMCDKFSGAVVSTSANPAGLLPAKTQAEVQHYFPSELDYILSGELGSANGPSVIRDLLSDKIFRE